MGPTQTYRLGKILGSGAYGLVFQAVEANSGRTVAIKKSRVSQRVKRPILRYESRVLQLLQGHPAIPAIYGYGQLPHFEYLAMELLGSSAKDRATGPVSVKTVVRIVLQMLSVLEHVHSRGFVHRDIKPENLLCSLTDPSKIILIDFGISKLVKPGPPNQYDPLKESRHIIGTLHWSSLNAHDGIDLAPRDDLESLAYTAFFLLRGDVPWRAGGSRDESTKASMRRIRASKAEASGDGLGAGFPHEFGHLLDYSRKLEYDQMPDYEELKKLFLGLEERIGDKDAEGPLDWTSVEVPEEQRRDSGITPQKHTEDSAESDDESDDDGDDGSEEDFPNSYYNWDIADWDIQGGRDRDLTFPVEQAELADGSISKIIEVTG